MQNVLFQYLMILVPQQNSIKKLIRDLCHEFLGKHNNIFLSFTYLKKQRKYYNNFRLRSLHYRIWNTLYLCVHNTYLAFNIIFLEQDVYQKQHHSVRFSKFSPYQSPKKILQQELVPYLYVIILENYCYKMRAKLLRIKHCEQQQNFEEEMPTAQVE